MIKAQDFLTEIKNYPNTETRATHFAIDYVFADLQTYMKLDPEANDYYYSTDALADTIRKVFRNEVNTTYEDDVKFARNIIYNVIGEFRNNGYKVSIIDEDEYPYIYIRWRKVEK